MPRPFVRPLITATLVVAVVALVGCSGPGGGGGGQTPTTLDPWLGDDLTSDAVVLSGDFMGVALAGLSCDVSESQSAGGASGVLPTASVIVTPAGSTIGYTDETLTSTAQGSDVPPSGMLPATISVVTTQGIWDIGDGGENTPWTPSADLALTAVPIPEDACTAADLWFTSLREGGADTAAIVEAFTKQGLKNVAAECPDAWFTWIPPDLTCEEFEALVG
jgi:hypothetical protein